MHIDALPTHPTTGLHALGIGRRGPIWPILGGSGEPDAPPADPASPPQEDPPKEDPAPPAFQAINTQEDLDKILGRRLGQERAKYSGFDDYKAKADKYDELEDAKKSTEQQLTERLQAVEQENATLKVDRLRGEVAAEKADEAAERLGEKKFGPKLAKLLAKRLTGTTREELLADADELLDDLIDSLPKADPKADPKVALSQQPKENLRGGGRPGDEAPQERNPRALAAQIPR